MRDIGKILGISQVSVFNRLQAYEKYKLTLENNIV